MPNEMTSAELNLLRIFNHIDKLPEYQSPKYRLLSMDAVIDGEKADKLSRQISTLSERGIIATTLVNLNGQTCLQIELLDLLTVRWRAMATEYLNNT